MPNVESKRQPKCFTVFRPFTQSKHVGAQLIAKQSCSKCSTFTLSEFSGRQPFKDSKRISQRQPKCFAVVRP